MNSPTSATGRFSVLRRDLLRKVRQVGVLKTLRHAGQKLIRDMTGEITQQEGPPRDPFDARYGTETARIISVGALDIPDAQLAHSNRYEAVVPGIFDAIMKALPIRHEDYVFVDVGAGKGRALLLAASFPYRQIVGVEISAALTEIARNNIQIAGDRCGRRHAIQVLCSDATLYELPPEDTVLYMYNPFDAQVMKAFVSRVEQSLREVPRKFFVAYHPPLHRFLWDESDSFKLVSDTDTCVIYEGTADGACRDVDGLVESVLCSTTLCQHKGRRGRDAQASQKVDARLLSESVAGPSACA